MTLTVTITLYRDSEGKYALDVRPLSILASPFVEDEPDERVVVKWLLVEDPLPTVSNVSNVVVSFSAFPTPFNLIIPPEGVTLPPDVYSTPASVNGAAVQSPPVENGAVGTAETAIKSYKYSVTVNTTDGQQLIIDPNVIVRRRKISRARDV